MVIPAMAIAEYITELAQEAGYKLEPKSDYKTIKMPPIGEAQTRPYQSEEMIESDPENGKMVCYCEKVSQAEIKNAMNGPVPAKTLEGLRRRTRCMQGRCQGFHCQADVKALYEQQYQQSREEGANA